MEELKTLEELYNKCINRYALNHSECNLIYSLCCCRATKEFPIDDLAEYVFEKELKPFTANKCYSSLFIMFYNFYKEKKQ